MMRGKKQEDAPTSARGTSAPSPSCPARTPATPCAPPPGGSDLGRRSTYPNPSLHHGDRAPKTRATRTRSAQGMMPPGGGGSHHPLEHQHGNPRDDPFRPGRAAPGCGGLQAEEQIRRGRCAEEAQGALPGDHPQKGARCRAATRSRPAATASSATCGLNSSPATATSWYLSEQVFGGSVPKNFFPAVEKGLRDCIAKGPSGRLSRWWA